MLALDQLHWTPFTELERSRDGGDPLGLRAAANRVGQRLSPALSQAASLTRGFGLLTLGLKLRADGLTPDEVMRRFERLWVHAHVDRLETGERSAFAGVNVARRNLSNDIVDLTTDLFQDQLTRGIWGVYRRPARLFGLIKPAETDGRRDARPSSTGLTARGRELAQATERAIRGPRALRLGAWLRWGEIDAAELADLSDVSATPTQAEVAVLTAAINGFDLEHRMPYRGLWDCWRDDDTEDDHTFTIHGLDATLLNDDQRRAVVLGRAVDTLIELIEEPYREWMVGEEVTLDRDVLEHPAWKVVRDHGEQDLIDLKVSLDRRASDADLFEAIDKHQRSLALERGAVAWDREMPNERWTQAERPDYGLTAPRNLFNEGVEPAAALDIDEANGQEPDEDVEEDGR